MKSKRSQAAIGPVGNDGGEPQVTRKDRVDAEYLPTKASSVAAMVTHVIEGVATPAKKDSRLSMMRETPHAHPRVLFPSSVLPAVVTPARGTVATAQSPDEPPAKRRLVFGRVVNEIAIQENVRLCYGIVKKLTGSIGGNASGGPIYGELTIGSMQKVVRILKTVTGLDSSSRFIDVGSGIGKPSIHVAQDPGVAFSYGIEVEVDRWLLGMSCLKGIFDFAVKQSESVPSETKIGNRCLFDLGDIRRAKTFEPFTHVYMFSIGYVTQQSIYSCFCFMFSTHSLSPRFPPALWVDLAEIWNRSSLSQYLICYHGPKDVIANYEFQVELITQTPTSMHGSKEGHTAYFYKRLNSTPALVGPQVACDPAFSTAWEAVSEGLESLRSRVESSLAEKTKSGTVTRASRRSS